MPVTNLYSLPYANPGDPADGAGNEQSMMSAVETAIKGVIVTKGSDQTITSNSTLTNDTALTVAVLANATYLVSLELIYGALAAGGLKIGFTAPASATFRWCANGLAAGVAITSGLILRADQVLTDAASLGSAAVNTTNVRATPYGTLVTAGTAGAFTLQWAQATSSATGTIMRTGSTLTIKRVA